MKWIVIRFRCFATNYSVFSTNWFIGSRNPVLMKDGGTHCEIIIISKKPRVLIIILHILFLIASKLKILTTKKPNACFKTALNLPQSVLEPPIGGALWINTPGPQVVKSHRYILHGEVISLSQGLWGHFTTETIFCIFIFDTFLK